MTTKCMIKEPGRPWVWSTIEDYKDLQKLVGGYLEAPGICPECTVYLNEEGKLKGLEPNMAWVYEGDVHDVLVGTLVVLGPPDDEGNDTDMTTPAFIKLCEHLVLI
jgi:hypothetical protein